MSSAAVDARAAALASAMTLMAIDLGLKRTGIAVGNRITESAEPLTTLHAGDKASRLAQVAKLVQEWQPGALIVGRPCHPDGNAHDMTRSAERFARQLAQELKIPVAMVDERYTSKEAEAMGAKDVDSMAACLILQRYFAALTPPIFV